MALTAAEAAIVDAVKASRTALTAGKIHNFVGGDLATVTAQAADLAERAHLQLADTGLYSAPQGVVHNSDFLRATIDTGNLDNLNPGGLSPTGNPTFNNQTLTGNQTVAGDQALGGDQTVAGGITVDEQSLFRTKVDIGEPGSIQGLDVGEGGSYFLDRNGVEIFFAYQYDASAPSGSRFTRISDLNAETTLLGDAGDRIYFGSPFLIWAIRALVGAVKSDEVYLAFYWSGIIRAMSYMVVDKTTTTPLSIRSFEDLGIVYVSWDRQIRADWIKANDELDAVPAQGQDLFWVWFEVPPGGLVTPPRIDEFRIRGTDTDNVTGTSIPVKWGQARQLISERINLSTARIQGPSPALVEKDLTSDIKLSVYDYKNNQFSKVPFVWKIPEGTDTGCAIDLSLDYWSDDTGSVDFTVTFKFLFQGAVIGVGESSSGSRSITTTPSAADTLQQDVNLTATSRIDISSCTETDSIVFDLSRDGSADVNSGSVFPVSFKVDYVEWTRGRPLQ